MARRSQDDIFKQLNNVGEESDYDSDMINRQPADDLINDPSHGSKDKNAERVRKTKKKKPVAARTNVRGTKRSRKKTNTQLIILTVVSVLVFLAMGFHLVYFNLYEKEEYVSSAYNKRHELLGADIIRGSITDKNGEVLAYSELNDSGEQYRVYPYADIYSHIIGYEANGGMGVEAYYNYDLYTCHLNPVEQIKNDFSNQKNKGDTVVTTLDTDLQTAAYRALGYQKGAVVCMEPSTGKILCMYSNPTFDPNSIASDWDYLNTDENNSPLLNRATLGLYPPGSIFKTVTALEYKRENSDTSGFTYKCKGHITYEDTTINCYNGNVHGNLNLESAFAYSCNSAFSEIGKELDTDKYISTAEDLMFNQKLPSVVTTAKSRFTLTDDDPVVTKMMTAFGQGDTLVSPYHMALITSAIANDGVLMKPYIVSEIQNDNGVQVSTVSPKEYKRLMSEDESEYLTSLMNAVVQYGTATALNGYGYTIVGKTGTAEYSSDKNKSHSWFIGFSDTGSPDLAVAVVLEGSDGNMSAVNVAGALFSAYHGN